MSVAPSDPRTAVVPTDTIWRLTVRRNHEMVRRGILTDDDPVELLQGPLVTKMPKNPPRRIATGLLREARRALCPPGWYVETQEHRQYGVADEVPVIIAGQPVGGVQVKAILP